MSPVAKRKGQAIRNGSSTGARDPRAGAQRGSAVRALNARDKGLLRCFDNELRGFFRMGDHEEVRRSLDLHDLLCAGALCHECSRRVRKVLDSSYLVLSAAAMITAATSVGRESIGTW